MREASNKVIKELVAMGQIEAAVALAKKQQAERAEAEKMEGEFYRC